MENWSQWIYDYMGMSHSIQYKIVSTIIIGCILYFLSRMTLHFVLRNVQNIKIRYQWKKSIAYGGYILFFIIISPIWFTELQSMGTFLGLLSAGLAVALKDPISKPICMDVYYFQKAL